MAAGPPHAPPLAVDWAGAPDRRAPGASVVVWIALLLIGGLLTFAGVMKIATGMPVQIAQGAAELLIVAALLWLRRAWASWALIACLFSAFAGWTGFQAWWGASSCGCFGAVRIAPEVTLTMDLAAVALAVGVTLLLTPLRTEVFAPLATACALCGAVGVGAAAATADPRPETFVEDETALFLSAPAYADIADSAGPTWFLYIYDPACPICQRHLPEMRGLESQASEDDAFRVRAISIHEIEEEAGVPNWAWERVPTTLIVQDGRIVERTSGDYVDPRAVAARYASEHAAPADPLETLLTSESFRELDAGEPGEPALLLYLHDASCSDCAAQVAVVDGFTAQMPDDPIMRAAAAPFEAIPEAPASAWGAREVTIVIRDGEVLRRYAPEETPDPMEIWLKLSGGLLLE